ncbi:MAG: 6-phosphogluconolactonase [Gammaproteobacteria bacterium]|nr:MAG: 6-phosphogluconolactonase [Gammaproteobacteria bacterium]
MSLRLTVAADPGAAAAAAAATLADWIRQAVAARGHCSLALSGGQTPWQMLALLPGHDVPWRQLDVFQVDERAVPFDDERRNARRIHGLLVRPGMLPEGRFHPMPVENPDPALAARDYSRALVACCGQPPVLDIVQLGLGPDGHTASLIPGDPLLAVTDADVGVSAPYQGTPRLSLTFPLINRARQLLWLITGESKAPMLARLMAGDTAIPAGRIAGEQALVIADAAANG